MKASKDGFDTVTEETSFEVNGLGSDDDDNTHDDKGRVDVDDGNSQGKSDDGEGVSDQALSQGNACGSGFPSTDILCQNVANQLQGDGNAINVIGFFRTVIIFIIVCSCASEWQATNVDTIESLVNQYMLARLDHAIETRLSSEMKA